MQNLLYVVGLLVLLQNSAPATSRNLQTDKWVYSETADGAGNNTYKAVITSATVLNFGFPYAGKSIATLTIRQRAGSTTAYLQVSKGQFNRSFQGGTARIRFDRKPATTHAYSAAENGSATIIFFDAAKAFIDQLKRTDKLVIDVEFYAQGRRQIAFNTAGLVWHH